MDEHECLYHEEPPQTKKTLLLCLYGLVTVAVHKKLVPWGLRVVHFAIACLKAGGRVVAARRCRRSRHSATKREDDQHGEPRTKTRITSVTVQSVSMRCRIRGVEIRLSDGVTVRIGSLSFSPPESVPLVLLTLVLLIFGRMRLQMRLLMLVASLLLLVSLFLLRQPWRKGKVKPCAISLQDVRVSLPGRPSVTKAASESASSGPREKALTLPAVVLLCAWFVAIEVRDLRAEISVEQEALKLGGSDNHDGTLDERTPGDSAAAAGVRTIELSGVRLTASVSNLSSYLEVSGARTPCTPSDASAVHSAIRSLPCMCVPLRSHLAPRIAVCS